MIVTLIVHRDGIFHDKEELDLSKKFAERNITITHGYDYTADTTTTSLPFDMASGGRVFMEQPVVLRTGEIVNCKPSVNVLARYDNTAPFVQRWKIYLEVHQDGLKRSEKHLIKMAPQKVHPVPDCSNLKVDYGMEGVWKSIEMPRP